MIPDWKEKANEIGLIREACREGEVKLAAQVTIATSADQRATVLAGIYVAAATGVIGALLTKPSGGGVPLIAAAVAAAGAFLCGAFLCLKATLPVIFWTPGNDPSEWYADIEAAKPEHIALGEQLGHYDKHIKANEATLKDNAKFFRWGAKLGIAAPIIGTIFAGLACLVFSIAGRL
jgi:hypothetical protein